MKHLKKMIALFLVAVTMALVVTGCSGNSTSGGVASGYPVEVGGVTINSQPTGVVVLSDSLADVVLALGYEAQLKGKSESCTQEELSVLNNMTMDDPSAITAAGANVVLTDTEPTEEQRSAMEQAGVYVVVLTPATNRESLTELYKNVGSLFMGSNTGGERGEKVANSTLLTLDDIARSIPDQEVTPRACYLYDLNGTAVTGDSFAGMLFSYAGLINIFESGSNNSTEGASITAGNPQYIFCDVGLKNQIMSSSKYKNLSAVKNGRVYEIDASLMRRQGGTILNAVSAMAGYVYPELLEDGKSDDNLSDILKDDTDKASSTTTSKTTSKASSTTSSKTSSKTSSAAGDAA